MTAQSDSSHVPSQSQSTLDSQLRQTGIAACEHTTTDVCTVSGAHPLPIAGDTVSRLQIFVSSEDALVAKLRWAVQELAGTHSVDQCTQLCLLIKACADALQSVRALHTLPDNI